MTSPVNYEAIAQRLLSVPPTAWDSILKANAILPGSSGLQEIERVLDGLAQKAGMASGYLGARGASGYGDHGDAPAMKEARKKEKKVRRALGYTNP